MKNILIKVLGINLSIFIIFFACPWGCFAKGGTFIIYNDADFVDFVNAVKYGEDFMGDNIILKTDINTERIFDEFTPIGDETHKFCGSFYGCNHTITLYINEPKMHNVGLFGWLSGAEIINLNLCGSVEGEAKVGALAGVFEDSIARDCHSSVSVKGLFDVGQFVGARDEGFFIGCFSNGEVEGSGSVDPFCGTLVNVRFMSY